MSDRIREIQRRVGTTVDGIWGPKSSAAVQSHLRRMMPHPHPWPTTDAASLNAFFGDPARGEVEPRLQRLDVAGMGVMFGGREVATIRVHQRCADSLLRVLYRISQSPHRGLLRTYAGVYNHRTMRGGTRWSLHAYGAAIDLDPARNGNHTAWPQVATMPLDVMEYFAAEGWLSGGAAWGRDAMHYQATR